ncbi:MAG: hypothetical protein ABSC92_16125 [Rhizomicrobium sp.]|jgi:hypothetical protein
MISPAECDPRKTPVVVWRGQEWPIPELAARQLIEAGERIERITDVLRALDKAAGLPENYAELPDREKREIDARRGTATLDRLYKFTKAQFEDLCEVVYIGLTRAHPKLSPDEFYDTPTSPAEMLIAFYVVRRQSRMYEFAPRRDAPPPGEDEARPTGSI